MADLLVHVPILQISKEVQYSTDSFTCRVPEPLADEVRSAALLLLLTALVASWRFASRRRLSRGFFIFLLTSPHSSNTKMIPRPSSNDTYPVVIWWACLTSLALLNTLCLLRRAHRTLEVVRDGYQPWLQRIRTRQFAMSALYVGGCAFRSALPCHHTLRHSLVRSFLCTGFVGRVVATIAELGAAVQVSLLLHELGVSTEDHATRNVSRAVVPLLFVAEIFSWYACVTTNYIGSIGEECLWAFCALLSLVSFLHAFPKYTGEQRRFVQKAVSHLQQNNGVALSV